MTTALRRLVAPLTLIGAVLIGTTACSPRNLTPDSMRSDTSKFCSRLKSDYDLTDLRKAIKSDNADNITSSLQRLRSLVDNAPKEIDADVRAVVAAVTQTVEAITRVGVDGPSDTPVDVDRLDESLRSVTANAQRIVAFADRSCDITLPEN